MSIWLLMLQSWSYLSGGGGTQHLGVMWPFIFQEFQPALPGHSIQKWSGQGLSTPVLSSRVWRISFLTNRYRLYIDGWAQKNSTVIKTQCVFLQITYQLQIKNWSLYSGESGWTPPFLSNYP